MVAIVFIVAGMSSRFNGKIKQFASVGPNGESLIEYSLNQALGAGFNKIIFVVGDMTEGPFRERFGNEYSGVPVCYAFQEFDREVRDRPWGTTEALCSAKHLIDGPFVVCNGDDIYGEEAFKIMVEHFKDSSEGGAIGYKLGDVMPDEGIINRGIFTVDGGYVREINEHLNIDRVGLADRGLSEDDLVSMNIFAFYPEMIEKLNCRLEKFKNGNKNCRVSECLLPLEITDLIKNNEVKIKVYPTSSKWFGVTNPEDEDIVREQLIREQLKDFTI